MITVIYNRDRVVMNFVLLSSVLALYHYNKIPEKVNF
jgi:hypothetical protein